MYKKIKDVYKSLEEYCSREKTYRTQNKLFCQGITLKENKIVLKMPERYQRESVSYKRGSRNNST